MARRPVLCTFAACLLALALSSIGCNNEPGAASGSDTSWTTDVGDDVTAEDGGEASDTSGGAGEDSAVPDTGSTPQDTGSEDTASEDTGGIADSGQPDTPPVPDVPTIDTRPQDTATADADPNESVACCGLGECRVATRSNCEQFGGTPKNADSCQNVTCNSQQMKKPCCRRGQCSMKTERECRSNLGEVKSGSSCSAVSCGTPKPCCIEVFGQNACIMGSDTQCQDSMGTQKSGSSCTDVQCGGQSMSACCARGRCSHTTKSACDTVRGTFHKDKDCADVSC